MVQIKNTFKKINHKTGTIILMDEYLLKEIPLTGDMRVLHAKTPDSWREMLIGIVENNPSLNKQIETMF